MGIRWIAIPLAATISILAVMGTTSAAEIYKWVDEDGLTHYSSHGPPEITQNLEVMEIESTDPEDFDPQLYEYSILNQAKRLPPREPPAKKGHDTNTQEREQRTPIKTEYEQITYVNSYPIIHYVIPTYNRYIPYRRFKHQTPHRPHHKAAIYAPPQRFSSRQKKHQFNSQQARQRLDHALKPKQAKRFRHPYAPQNHRPRSPRPFSIRIGLSDIH